MTTLLECDWSFIGIGRSRAATTNTTQRALPKIIVSRNEINVPIRVASFESSGVHQYLGLWSNENNYICLGNDFYNDE